VVLPGSSDPDQTNPDAPPGVPVLEAVAECHYSLQGCHLYLGLLHLLLHIRNVLKQRQPFNLIRIGILL
jgi:hypothetical protein